MTSSMLPLVAQQAAVPEAAVSLGARMASWMNPVFEPSGRLAIAFVFGVAGTWLLLPTGRADFKRCGVILSVIAATFFASLLRPFGDPVATAAFSIIAGITVASALATIVSVSPVYSAIWFAATLLGTGGLFLLNGAEFLGVATVAVYAGAIVVTFLFVLMLAQPEGNAFYDRISWGGMPALLATVAGLLLVAVTVWNARTFCDSVTASAPTQVVGEQHVAALGSQLFSKHLIAIQAAGVLLFAALVGAVAIAGRDQLVRREVGSLAELGAPQSQRGGPSDE